MMSPPPVSKARKFKDLLHSGRTEFLLEAHNGLSARLVEQGGFQGIWASGLGLSAQFGVRDNNEASWTQIIEMLEFMSDITGVPILLDGDTGYGNFNNMRRLVKKLEQRHIAAVCIEDKQYPKTNSFIGSERQALADINEFCGKIQAGKDSQQDPDFCIIARVEALIVGQGLSEALRRAERYRLAGADGILIHSKLSRPDEILDFAAEWANRSPLLIIPTTYYSTPVEVFERVGISLVIWANHMIRAAIASMKKVSTEIQQSRSVINIEHQIATMQEVFSLQGAEELACAEQRYLYAQDTQTQAIILAASRGHALQSLTQDRPKVMLAIGGKTILRHLLDEFKRQSIHQVTLVAGYKADTISDTEVNMVVNHEYASTDELASLGMAAHVLAEDVIITYGDLLIRSYILRDLLEAEEDVIVVVDSAMAGKYVSGRPDYAYCDQTDDRALFRQSINLQFISDKSHIDGRSPSGRWIGMLRVRGKGVTCLQEALRVLGKRDNFTLLTIPDILNHLVEQGCPVAVHYIHGHWLDVNTLEDMDRAHHFAGH